MVWAWRTPAQAHTVGWGKSSPTEASSRRQLAEALRSQEQTGRLLGEICVEKWGLDRFALADALGEQWVEIEHG